MGNLWMVIYIYLFITIHKLQVDLLHTNAYQQIDCRESGCKCFPREMMPFFCTNSKFCIMPFFVQTPSVAL